MRPRLFLSCLFPSALAQSVLMMAHKRNENLVYQLRRTPFPEFERQSRCSPNYPKNFFFFSFFTFPFLLLFSFFFFLFFLENSMGIFLLPQHEGLQSFPCENCSGPRYVAGGFNSSKAWAKDDSPPRFVVCCLFFISLLQQRTKKKPSKSPKESSSQQPAASRSPP